MPKLKGTAKPRRKAARASKARKACAEPPRRPGRPRETPDGLPVYPSMLACAGATGIPVMVLRRALADGCPGFRHGRVDLAQVLPWMFRTKVGNGAAEQTELPLNDSTTIGASARKNLAQAKIVERELAKLDGKLKPVDEVAATVNGGMNEVFSTLDRGLNELPPVLAGLNEIGIRNKLKSEYEAMKSAMRERFLKLAEPKPEGQKE